MNKFWTALLETAVQKLLQADWGVIMAEVCALMSADMTGREKADYAFQTLRRMGCEASTWLLKVGIEVAYSIVKREGL